MVRLSVIIPDELKRRLESFKKEKETTADLLGRLIEAQEQLQIIQGLDLTPEQQQEVKQAQASSGFSFVQIAKQGLLTRARSLSAFANKLASTDLSDKSSQTRFFGVAQARIHQKVQQLMQLALQPISQKVLTKETHANLKAIKSYLLQHQAEIEAYNQSLAAATTPSLASPQPPATPKLPEPPELPKPQAQALKAKTTSKTKTTPQAKTKPTQTNTRTSKKRQPNKAKRR